MTLRRRDKMTDPRHRISRLCVVIPVIDKPFPARLTHHQMWEIVGDSAVVFPVDNDGLGLLFVEGHRAPPNLKASKFLESLMKERGQLKPHDSIEHFCGPVIVLQCGADLTPQTIEDVTRIIGLEQNPTA